MKCLRRSRLGDISTQKSMTLSQGNAVTKMKMKTTTTTTTTITTTIITTTKIITTTTTTKTTMKIINFQV